MSEKLLCLSVHCAKLGSMRVFRERVLDMRRAIGRESTIDGKVLQN